MYIEMDNTHIQGGYGFEGHLREVVQEQAEHLLGDFVEFSDEAIQAFKEAAIEPIKNGTFSLKQMEQRINVVRTEIAQVWNSALPDDEKYRQISAKENEICLLQAGQFTFARAGFTLSV
ncbi:MULTISPECIES: hypothetical protein [unclassified Pseudodesulfovibrio]|uniref:hypothetical protein n=1 Tax=unclassified Pseudodesulfovibrio TaxID=2661612 RepID=UPI000FEB91E1|nr:MULTISPECIES: hypothetical protein [unclassified Pseudodesulfovibrio]MCJ2165950.1 hypothetical protein [Pseudodesulfovibrio sp. S3-i]RWU02625.1 hypothetical protein DWB63_15285 [Pseudodesulfovibrio sp. S3]